MIGLRKLRAARAGSSQTGQWIRRLRVRINMTLKAINEKGGVIWSVPVQDAPMYQALFNKIDNSLFLAREKI
ncbi:MAG: hypothetical protein ACM30I_10445 [Gemmatimonas sp.]